MKWLKDNPFLAGLIVVTVAGLGVLGYFLSDILTRYQETTDGYTQAVQKLHGLQGQTPFPSKENLEKSRAVTAEYKTGVDELRKRLATMQLPLNPAVTPQQFQDDLRKTVNETVAKATEAGVALPKDFYLGFNPYATSLPSEQAAPFLARELAAIKQIVQELIDLKIQSLDQLNRMSISQEAAPASTPNPPGSQGGRPPARKAALIPSDLYARLPFDLAFTAEQSKYRVAFNSLLDHSQFLIIRNLEVQNSIPTPPPIVRAAATNFPLNNPSGSAPSPASGATTKSPPAPSPAPGGSIPMPPPMGSIPMSSPPPSNDLNVILGRELVKATMQIEILNFTASEAETKPEAK